MQVVHLRETNRRPTDRARKGAVTMDPVERLTAIEEIKQLKARYFRCMDMKDWEGHLAVFAPDVAVDMSGEMPPGEDGMIRGATEFVTFNRGHIEDVLTVHHGHMPEIEITSDTTATGTWAMEDMLRWPEGGPMRTLHGYGHYHETYEKLDGEWRIKTMKLTRLRRDVDFG
jgi:SnoaL-like domain